MAFLQLAVKLHDLLFLVFLSTVDIRSGKRVLKLMSSERDWGKILEQVRELNASNNGKRTEDENKSGRLGDRS